MRVVALPLPSSDPCSGESRFRTGFFKGIGGEGVLEGDLDWGLVEDLGFFKVGQPVPRVGPMGWQDPYFDFEAAIG